MESAQEKMKRRISRILVLTVCLAFTTPWAARGQNGVYGEHDWTVQVGSSRFGVAQWRSSQRYTSVYVGRCWLVLPMHAGWVIAMFLVPVGAATALTWRRRS